MGIAETKIYPINTGWLEADLGTYIFWKGPAGKKYWNPVYCHYVDTGEHKILIDTGCVMLNGPLNTITNVTSVAVWKCMIT